MSEYILNLPESMENSIEIDVSGIQKWLEYFTSSYACRNINMLLEDVLIKDTNSYLIPASSRQEYKSMIGFVDSVQDIPCDIKASILEEIDLDKYRVWKGRDLNYKRFE